MTALIVIAMIIANFFICRSLQRKSIRLSRYTGNIPIFFWFFPGIGIIICLIDLSIAIDLNGGFKVKNSFLRKLLNMDLKKD